MFKMDCQKNNANNTRYENTELKIKPIKTGKKLKQRIVKGVQIILIILSHKKSK